MIRMKPTNLWFLLALSACTGSGRTEPAMSVPGTKETTRTNILEASATALQEDAPTDGLDIYLVGFHPMNEDPAQQFEAHHFCKQIEAKPGLAERRDERMGISTGARRQARQELTPLARPQAGVDALKGRFKGPIRPIHGVIDKQAAGS
ncbi:hypothetical protein [Virgifigura deserti]|uniref:hypothetical protein n=1 Tax=Virgifigura deserti TaxID=2268457 RepID=UPI003CCC01E2